MPNNIELIVKQIDDLVAQHTGVRARSKYDDLSDLPDSSGFAAYFRGVIAGVRR